MPRTPLLALLVVAAMLPPSRAQTSDPPRTPGGGELIIDGPEGQPTAVCPLKHTDVQCDIAGFLARTTVKQVFSNPTNRKIEAVYVFPLPQNAAVDDMVMTVGDRRIVGTVKPRDEAREIYERARAAGHVASLLDQERPNIFTQSVANIEPGATVTIEIRFVETLKFEDGTFEWTFPMVVGPRYIPGGGSAPAPLTSGQPTPQVPDAPRITPPVAPQGTRAGHDISVSVHLDAGMPIIDLSSVLHAVDVERADDRTATIRLKNQQEIPNRDFVLRYRVGGDEIGDAFLTHTDERGTYFTLILQPPQRVIPDQVVNRELIFVLDTSGSMRGFPIDKAKDVMMRAIDAMRPGDTFNVITFAGDTAILWPQPQPATQQAINEAKAFLASREGRGGTEMMSAISAALTQKRPGTNTFASPEELVNLPADGRDVVLRVPYETWSDPQAGGGDAIRVRDGLSIRLSKPRTEVPFAKSSTRICPTGGPLFITGTWATVHGERVFQPKSQSHDPAGVAPIRVVVFMTDGYVGNDMEIIDAVKRNAGTTRVFSFGIGNSVNRFLLDGMAAAGRGEVEYVTLESVADAAVQRLHERILAPVLTDVTIDWTNLPVDEVYPATIPDLFAAKPVVVHGRLKEARGGSFRLRGNTGGGPFNREISVAPPNAARPHPVVPSLWARAKVDHLLMGCLAQAQSGNVPVATRDEITALGVQYRLMTQFTSFVAVEEHTVTVGGQPTRVQVPVEMPDGVSYEGIFGPGGDAAGKPMLHRVGRGSRALESASGRPAAAPLPATPPAVGARARRATERTRGEASSAQADMSDVAEIEAESPPASAEKLTGPLATLAERVEREGRNGDLTVDGVRVAGYRVMVIVAFSALSDATRSALQKLGFEVASEGSAAPILIGSIDVRKLKELSELAAVTRVTAVTQ